MPHYTLTRTHIDIDIDIDIDQFPVVSLSFLRWLSCTLVLRSEEIISSKRFLGLIPPFLEIVSEVARGHPMLRVDCFEVIKVQHCRSAAATVDMLIDYNL
jgi:hypothetical protein